MKKQTKLQLTAPHYLSLSLNRFADIPTLIPFDTEDELLSAEHFAEAEGYFAFSLYRGHDY